MRKIKYGGLVGCFMLLCSLVLAQQGERSLSWEEAGRKAVAENKLVLVAVGLKPDQKAFTNGEVKNFLTRHAIPVIVDLNTEEGQKFLPKLLLYPYPTYAFFMPFGDLLAVVSPEEVARRPSAFIEAGREALQLAEVKKSNSRTIRFENIRQNKLAETIGQSEKPVFIYVGKEPCQACLLMEKRVFNTDAVADFYNKNFLCIQLMEEGREEGMKKYKLSAYPAYLFVNAAGKLIYDTAGYLSREELIHCGQRVLDRAAGIRFTKGNWADLLAKAAEEKKMIFVDGYTSPAGEQRKKMDKIYKDPEVTTFFQSHFINVTVDFAGEKELGQSLGIEKTTALCFVDEEGKLVHQLTEAAGPDELLQAAGTAVAGGGLAAMTADYVAGNRDAAFVETYIDILGRAGKEQLGGKVTVDYLQTLDREKWKEKKYWDLFNRMVTDADSEVFQYLYAHRDIFYNLYGERTVNQKFQHIWIAGAFDLLREDQGKVRLDEAAFKAYTLRMKKEKVKDWRGIVRDVRMSFAEKTGDWKVFTELAEEKWNEEQIPEAELYSWGVLINENCRDKSIRYRAARWFALAASKIEQRERQTGKISPASYKGFFEKLVDDLVK